MKIIIIGNGAAGLATALELRKSGIDRLVIDMFTDEPCFDYSRPRLPDYIGAQIAKEALFMHNAQWYEKNGITLHQNTTVTAIDRTKKTIQYAGPLDTAGAVSYDALILATGASSNIPPLTGADLPCVFTLRTVGDASRILDRIAQTHENAVVIGGGLLGLETARALKQAGVLRVSVVEIAPRLLPRQLDEDASALLCTQLTELGLTFYTGASVDALETGANGNGATVILKDGKRIEAQTVVLSMGVHSNTALAKSCGLAVNRGIVVNARMQTGDESIYAIGDCAEFEGVVWGIIPAALEQASVAARFALAALSGAEAKGSEYSQIVPKTQLKIAGIEASAAGLAVLSPEDKASGLYTEHKKIVGTRYEKLVTKKDGDSAVLCGAIFYGSKEHVMAATKLMGKPINTEQLNDLLKF